MIPLVVCVVIVGSVAALAYSHIRANSVTNVTWDDLLGRLQPLSSEGIAIAAFDRLSHAADQSETGRDEMWKLVGGLPGLQRIRQNADVMIALAAFAERRNNHERMIIAERMRHDGLMIRRAVTSIRIARSLRLGTDLTSAHLRDAVRAYEQMRQRLPALFELSRGGPQLSFS